MTLQQAANTEPLPHVQVLLMNNHLKECEHILSQLFQEQTESDVKRWHPTPETCDDPSNFNEIERCSYDEIITFRGKEQLNPVKTIGQRKEFFSKFNWEECLLNEDKKTRVEDLLVKYHSFFAGHGLDKGINTEFKVKLTPQHEKPVYSQNLPTRTNLKEELLVKLALMQEYGLITTFLSSEHSSPIFTQRKPNSKLRLMVDLRQINHLIKLDYGERNHSVTTISDASQHTAGRITSVN